MNMVALVDGQPRLLNLKQFLEFFLQHRREVVVRRTRFELRKARERGHILEGLAVALSNVDEIIALIKAAATPAEAKVGADGAAPGARRWSRRCSTRAAADAARPEGLAPRVRLAAARVSARLPAVGRAGAGDPRAAAAAPDRARAGQDHRRISRGDGADRRPARHPRQAGARHHDHRRRAQGDPRPVRRQAPLRDRRAERRSVDRGPDRARGHGRHAVARRLHEGAAGRRIPRAATRRPRQAGDRQPRKTISSTTCSSPTRTTSSCASRTADACTG